MVDNSGSTVPRRQLGRHLRELRDQAKLTVKAASDALEWSPPKIWRIESGQTSMRSLDVEQMCRLYSADATLTEALMALARETKSRGWWQAYGEVIPRGFDVYIGLEAAALSLATYESELIPGLFQTEDYARAVIKEHNDDANAPDDDLDRRLHLKMERQDKILRRRAPAPPTVDVVLNEAIIRRPIGGPAVMAGQMQRLLELDEQDNVTIRVVPFGAGVHIGAMTGPFVLLGFPLNGDGKPTEPPTVYVEGFTGALYLDKPEEIKRYDAAWRRLEASALDRPGSRELIASAMKEMDP